MWAKDYAQELSANKLLPTPVFAVCIHTANRKTGRGFRRSRIPSRRAHDTLQPQDESIIVGYYTFAKVSLRNATLYNTNKTQEVNAYGKRRWYPSYKCKKRKIS